MTKKVAMVVAGCGHKDGTELTEAISAWVALDELGVEVHFFAPDVEFNVKDPRTGEPTGDTRNALAEAARLARGHVLPLRDLDHAGYDAVVFPGGFGAATILSDWAARGAAARVLPDVARVLREFSTAAKPIGTICIAPTLVAKVLGESGVTLTHGHDAGVAVEIKKTGATPEACAPDDFITDREHRVVTTPAYMYADARPAAVFSGIRQAMRELVEMA